MISKSFDFLLSWWVVYSLDFRDFSMFPGFYGCFHCFFYPCTLNYCQIFWAEIRFRRLFFSSMADQILASFGKQRFRYWWFQDEALANSESTLILVLLHRCNGVWLLLLLRLRSSFSVAHVVICQLLRVPQIM